MTLEQMMILHPEEKMTMDHERRALNRKSGDTGYGREGDVERGAEPGARGPCAWLRRLLWRAGPVSTDGE